MKFLEIRGRKNTDGTHVEYVCHGCNAKIFYAAFTDDDGNIITEDGQKPNGKFGKESNVKGFKVEVNNKEKVHECPNYNENTSALADKSLLLDNDSKPTETGEGMSETYKKTMGAYKMKELKTSDLISDDYIQERKMELDLIIADENIVKQHLLESGMDANPAHVGLLMKLLDERLWRKKNG